MNYYTEHKVDITQRIVEGKTFFFSGTELDSRKKAEEKARNIRSYVFDVFGIDKESGRLLFVGFGVSK